MEHHAQATQPTMEFTSAYQTAYAAPTYRPAAAVAGAPTNETIPPPFSVPPPHPSSAPTYRPAVAVAGASTNGTIPPTFPVPPHPFAYPQVPQFYHPQQQQLLQEFWSNQMQEIEQTTDFKNHSLPLARIKKIMKADEDVRMISSEAPAVFAKACEIFILELTLRSWIHAEENKRRTLQKNDIAGAISRTDMFDFLVDIVPRDEVKEEGPGIPRAVGPGDQMPYYYMPSHVDPATVAATAGAYGVQDPRLMAYMLQQAQAQVQGTPEAAASTDAGN